jgi:hypothetical protein
MALVIRFWERSMISNAFDFLIDSRAVMMRWILLRPFGFDFSILLTTHDDD